MDKMKVAIVGTVHEKGLVFLKDNGFAIIFVPAIMALWSHNDIYSEHFRRYEKPQFLEQLRLKKTLILIRLLPASHLC